MRNIWKIHLLAILVAMLTAVWGTSAFAAPTGMGSSNQPAASSPGGQGSKTAPKAKTKQFENRVATFNVCNPCRGTNPLKHVAQIAKEISVYEPQVISLEEICVQEARLVQQILKDRAGLDYYIQYGSVTTRPGRCFPFGSAYGNALLSLAPLTNPINHIYEAGGTEPRGYVAADTQLNGQTVRVFGTHLAQHTEDDPQTEVRQKQVGELVTEAIQYPNAIVLGDFNAQPWDPELNSMWTWFQDADPNCTQQKNPACQATLGEQGTDSARKYDYIWLRNGTHPGLPGVGVHDNFSDHRLVHADLL